MIALLLGLAVAAPVRFDRVDLLSETSGTWLHDELPRAGTAPTVVGLRYLEQVQPVLGFGEWVQLGLALRTQSLRVERVLGDSRWAVNGGVQLHAGLPNGLVAGLAWRQGPVRIGGGLSLTSGATWARPVYEGWRTLPVLGLGLGPVAGEREPKGAGKAPWM